MYYLLNVSINYYNMDLSNIPKALIEKIQKLLRLQEGATTIEEAANAASKIADMLKKYNLDMASVRAANAAIEEEVVLKNVYDTSDLEKSHEGGWVDRLIRIIAKDNMCRAIGLQGTSKIYVFGTKTNAEMSWYITEQLVNRLRPMSREAFAIYEGNEKRNTFFRGYFAGAVIGIGEQLMRNAKKAEEQADEDRHKGAQTEGLMILNMVKYEEKRTDEVVRQFTSGARMVSSNKRGTSSQGGRVEGYKAGSTMGIHGGLSPRVLPKNRRIG